MRAILIDPVKQAVTEVQWDGTLKDIYAHTQTDRVEIAVSWQCDDFAVYVDEEGLFKQNQEFFQLMGCYSPLAGRGLMVGPVDNDGNETELKFPLADAEAYITWLPGIEVIY